MKHFLKILLTVIAVPVTYVMTAMVLSPLMRPLILEQKLTIFHQILFLTVKLWAVGFVISLIWKIRKGTNG